MKTTIVCIAILASGCSSITTNIDSTKVAAVIGHIEPSKKDTCATQVQIAAQSSRIDTIIKGTETIYKAPCLVDKKPEPVPPSEPKTS